MLNCTHTFLHIHLWTSTQHATTTYQFETPESGVTSFFRDMSAHIHRCVCVCGYTSKKHSMQKSVKKNLFCAFKTLLFGDPSNFHDLNPHFSSSVLTSPVRPSSNSTSATGLLDTCPLLADVCRSTLHFRPLRPGSQRLWAKRLSRTRVRWVFQKRARAAACSGVTPPPPCLRVCAVRKASSCVWSMSADAMDWRKDRKISLRV